MEALIMEGKYKIQMKMYSYKYLVILSIFWGSLLFSQKIDSSKIECKYLVTFLIDTANVNTIKKEIASLLIGDNISLFRSNQKQISDSLTMISVERSMANPVDGKVLINTSGVASAKFKPEVFFKSGRLMIYDEILNNTYSYENKNALQWLIEKEYKTIKGYKCRKATCSYNNKRIIAWFTDEIPISEGPYRFKGLPGLVLEAYDTKEYFHFLLEGLKYTKKPMIPVDNCIATTYEKFSKKRKEVMDDPVSAFISIFGKRLTKNDDERIIRNIRSKNNFLD
ncbi:GLPGLI family protein [Chryseobacterium indologenes]|uniref:GLPGLI family protein n=1 Tax=Chryseobacterium indologenes TaxID=253 RepID=UPI003019D3B0